MKLYYKNIFKNKSAFTLVELVVVVFILAVLWTIAFLTFSSYSRDARDSIRVNDINNLISSLTIFEVDKWYYPEPDNKMDVTYSGWVVWNQWSVWEELLIKLDKLSKLPLDPLTWNEYTYSRTSSKKEFELSNVLEWSLPSSFFPFKTYASYDASIAYVKWDYNWFIVKTSTWWLTYVIWTPSIITSDQNNLDLVNIISNRKLVYNWFNKLPTSYSWSVFFSSWEFGFSPNNLIVFEWDLNIFKTDEDARLELLSNIQNNYRWTILSTNWIVSSIVDTSLDLNNPSKDALYLSDSIVRNILWIIPSNTIVLSQNTTTTINHDITKDDDLYNLSDDELKNIFWTGSYYTKNWASNLCDVDSISIITATWWTFSNSYSVPENTIIKVPNWDYDLSWVVSSLNDNASIKLTQCSAIVWESKSGVVFNSNFPENPPIWIWLYLNNNSILTNFSFDWADKNLYLSTIYSLSNSTISNWIVRNTNWFNLTPISLVSNNFLDRIEMYDLYRHALEFWNSNLISNIKIYNSWIKTTTSNIFSIAWNNNAVNNIILFNNKSSISKWIIDIQWLRYNNSFNNLQVFNNSAFWFLCLYCNNNLFNNAYFYSNKWWIKIEAAFTSVSNTFNNTYFYNNSQVGLNAFSAWAFISFIYYWDFSSFANTISNIALWSFSNIVAWTSWNSLWLDEWNLINWVWTMSCDYHSQPNLVSSWWTSCQDKEEKSSWITTPVTSYVFWSSIRNQTRPIRWNNSISDWEYYWEDGVDYDSTKKIGQW